MTGRQHVHLNVNGLAAAIDPRGAELRSLRTGDGQELIWQGDPASWPDQAPILFPVIGPVTDGQIHHNGETFPMPAHGFAKERDFTIAEQTDRHCVFELHDDESTRVHYPFAFTLRVTFEISQESLLVTMSVDNRSAEALPADAGFHPGFNWPLSAGTAKDDYAIVFAEPEPAPIRRGVDDPIFLAPGGNPTPVEGRVLQPRDELFEENAIVFDQLNSRSLVFGSRERAGTPRPAGLRIDFPDSPYLAIWSRPGAAFLAIEPWQGLPSPVDFRGTLAEKPGIAMIPPGETRAWRLGITPVTTLEENA